MKRTFVIALGTLMMVTFGYAQQQLRADIPFQFMAGDQLLPAGSYSVAVEPEFRRIVVHQRDGSGAAYLSLGAEIQKPVAERSSLVFHKYGKSCFLRQVRLAGQSTVRELPGTQVERRMAREHRVEIVAWNATFSR